MKIRILDKAQEDLYRASYFYEQQQIGLGTYFLKHLFADIESLEKYAGIHRKFFGYYRLLSKKFPYAIYYIIENNTIDVYAVLDCRQNPEKTIKRLKL